MFRVTWARGGRAVPYAPTIYLGSAAHYRYGRPAYSPELEAVLTREAGRRAAGEQGVTNIQWVQRLAEDLPAVAPGPYRLVTFGQSAEGIFWDWPGDTEVVMARK